MLPQDREAAKRETGEKRLVLSGGVSGRPKEEWLTDTEHRRRMRAKEERDRLNPDRD